MSEKIYLNEGWKFTQQYQKELSRPDFDERSLEEVRLPHTCKETPFHYFDEHIYQMVSAYRRVLRAPREWQGKKVLLTIEGAAHESEVFLNGEKMAEHHCGYTAFTVDLSDRLHYEQDNVLVVKVDSREDRNIPPFGFVIDYMTYGGIYRDVYLDIKEPVYLEDVFLRSAIGKETSLCTQVSLNREAEEYHIRQSIREKDGEFRLLGTVPAEKQKTQMVYTLENIRLWDVEDPFLYEVKTELLDGDRVVDEHNARIGFRRAEFKSDGFYLNGKKFKIRGLNRHQSYPYVGYAMPRSMQERDADILKEELGLNAVRTSHYPQSHYFLDRCDEIGLLVFTELPGWQHIGDAEWKDQAVQNVRDMVKQYRNHTSIIMWGVRINESQDDDEFYRRTNEAARSLDPYRPTGGVRAHKKSSLLEDVYTYNDFLHDGTTKGCETKADVTSNTGKAYLISEYNGHMYPTKTFDWEEHRAEHALRHANVLDAVAAQEDISGSFGWCMADYNTHQEFGSGDRICYHGVLDMFRNPKMAADIYACQQEEIPVLSLSSSMDIGEHPGCNRGNTYIFTNADSVKMYKNDRFIKEYKKEDSPYRHLAHGPLLIDDFIGNAIEEGEDFKPGQAAGVKEALNMAARFGLSNLPKSIYPLALKLILVYRMKPEQAVKLYNRYIGDWGGSATSYRFEAVKDGKVVKEIRKEPMKSVHIRAEADHTVMQEEHTYDVAAVRITAVDEYENLLPFYQEPVFLELDGPAELIGPDVISLKGGMGGTYIKTIGVPGIARLRVRTEQGGEVKIDFEIKIK